jgi:hypothetical protein
MWAALMSAVHSMVDLWAAYTLLQGIILVLLVFRWAGNSTRVSVVSLPVCAKRHGMIAEICSSSECRSSILRQVCMRLLSCRLHVQAVPKEGNTLHLHSQQPWSCS